MIFAMGFSPIMTPLKDDMNNQTGIHQSKVNNTDPKLKLITLERQKYELQREQEIFNDLLLLDLIEDYYLLTVKMMSVFTWISDRCQNHSFILKVDKVSPDSILIIGIMIPSS